MTTAHAPGKPLGYYLRHIDRMLEENFAALLADHGLVRRSWQVINTISAGPVTLAELDRAHAHFLDDAEPTVAPQVTALVDRGVVAVDADGNHTLTSDGRSVYAAVSQLIDAERAATIDGLGPDGYRVLIGMLQRIADNLDAIARERN
ncbi:MarR family winged helix-turn-helix transcriptional regulator [Nocardia sp. NPDC127526]|uniref:MarR family winged helix-turn-helix transcriptional regulator n=1 Tax=Nocardia sp. NPDC127526 TaxID=3345393 RepID=UPI0036253C79